MSRSMTLVLGCLLVLPALAGAQGDDADGRASHLAKAEKYVRASDRYLHHSRLEPGMTGYGLTVLSGTEIVRFEAKILSVLQGMAPHRDMILALLDGPGAENFLATSGIIAGMSGSPVYIRGEDGKDRMIGAVAYGWFAEKKPICGIQPISQMIAVSGLIDADKGQAEDGGPQAARPGRGRPGRNALSGKRLRQLLSPQKKDLSPLVLPREPEGSTQAGTMPRLPIPLSVGISDPTRRKVLAGRLGPMGFVPVPAAGVAGGNVAKLRDVKLQPGSAISVPLVTGDQDWTAIGTVTEVVDGHVLAFGHSFFGEGESNWAMGPAYVHTVIPTFNSFKIGSTIRLTGATYRDEQTALVGKKGLEVEMMPLTVRMRRAEVGRSQVFRYKVARDPAFTGMLTFALISESFASYALAPEHHHVAYRVTVDYGDFGRYAVENVSPSTQASWPASDTARPVLALSNNGFDEPRYPRGVEVEMVVRSGEISQSLEKLRLDSSVVRPGQTLRGELTLRPWRGPRRIEPVSMEIPENLPDGQYELAVTGMLDHLSLLTRFKPHLFDPDDAEQLLAGIQRVNGKSSKQLYLHLQLPEGGTAIGVKELPNLPASRAAILAEAPVMDVRPYQGLLTESIDVDYLPSGGVTASFTVQRQTDQATLDQKERK